MNSFFNYFVSKQLFEDEEPPRTRNLGLIFAKGAMVLNLIFNILLR